MENFLNLPKVSFIVVTHNFENFVCDTLISIKNQTYKNFEIIVVDDLSKDSTREKIQKFILFFSIHIISKILCDAILVEIIL